MQRVRLDDGGGIPGESPDESTWEGGGDATELENPGRWGQTTDFPNGIPGEGRPAELPGEGMHGPSGDKDRDVGALPAPACPRQRGHSGGGKPPHPRCAQCNMLVPRRALKGRHPATSQCARGAERKRRRLAEAETREISERDLEAYGEPLENVTTFSYLGQVLTAGDDDWLAVVGNPGKA